MHVIAAKAVALGEALKPEFKTYQKQVMENAKTMARGADRSAACASSRAAPSATCSWSTCTPKNLTGKDAEAALGRAHITVNKNAIPNDPQKPMVTSGVRIGSPAMTTRGFKKAEAEPLANLIADVLDKPADDANLERVANEVKALCSRFPVYGTSDEMPFLRLRGHPGGRHPGEPRGEHRRAGGASAPAARSASPPTSAST